MNKWMRLAICETVSFSAAVLGGMYSAQGLGDWYDRLSKSSLNPPGWVFGPVWTLLYALIGVSLWGAWNASGKSREKKKKVVTIFGIQLFLNVAWSYLFFAAKEPALALVEVLVLWLSIATMMVRFSQIKRWTGWILLPYLIWVGFAGYLNYMVVALN